MEEFCNEPPLGLFMDTKRFNWSDSEVGALKIWVEETSTNRDERILAAPRKYSSSHSDMYKRTVDAPILELLKTPDEAMRQICIRRLIEVCCGPHAMNARGERASASVKRSTRARFTCSSFCNRNCCCSDRWRASGPNFNGQCLQCTSRS